MRHSERSDSVVEESLRTTSNIMNNDNIHHRGWKEINLNTDQNIIGTDARIVSFFIYGLDLEMQITILTI